MEKAPRGGEAAGINVGGDEEDTLFELCSHSYRRFVLGYLDDLDGLQTAGEVARALDAWQADVPVADPSATGVDAIELALHHHHLPQTAAASVLEYDLDRSTATPGARAAETIPYPDEIGGR